MLKAAQPIPGSSWALGEHLLTHPSHAKHLPKKPKPSQALKPHRWNSKYSEQHCGSTESWWHWQQSTTEEFLGLLYRDKSQEKLILFHFFSELLSCPSLDHVLAKAPSKTRAKTRLLELIPPHLSQPDRRCEMPFTQPRGQNKPQPAFGLEPLIAQPGVAPMAETGLYP